MSQEYYEDQWPPKPPQLGRKSTVQDDQANQANQANQPPYRYRDPSLSPTPETSAAISTRRLRFRWVRFLIQLGFILLPFVGAWIVTSHYAATYNTYQQGLCTVTGKDVNEVDAKDKYGNITSRTYFPRLYYDVQASNGVQVSGSGYDGPTAQGYAATENAQSIIDQYQVGQVVACWYNPAAPEKSYIVFYGFTRSDSGSISFEVFFGIVAFLVPLYLLFDWTVWRLFALQRRGVVMQGKVVEVQESRDRSGKIHYTSIIHFQAQEESARTRKIKLANTQLDIGTLLPICYDPFFPRYRRNGEWPHPFSPFAGSMAMAVVALIGFASC